MSDIFNKVPKEVISARSDFDFKTDAEYYYYRGKQAALAGVWRFINEGGTYRNLCYDCLDMDYSGALSAGMHICNWMYYTKALKGSE